MNNSIAGVWVKASHGGLERDGWYNGRWKSEPCAIDVNNGDIIVTLPNGKIINDPPLNILEWLDESQPIPVNQDESYWQKRCEAAEDIVNSLGIDKNRSTHRLKQKEIDTWQQLKSSPSPIPVQETQDEIKWTDELVQKFAEMYRFSSSRTSLKQFKEMIKENNGWLDVLPGQVEPADEKEK